MKVLLILVALFTAFSTYAGSVMLNLSAPTNRVDNDPISHGEIAGFRLYTPQGTLYYQNTINITGDITQVEVPTVRNISYTLYARTVDKNGNESVNSQVIIIPEEPNKADPRPPGVTVSNP